MENTIEELIEQVVDCAYQVHHTLGPGFLESVYQNAMMVELKEQGIKAISEYPLDVIYKDVNVGEFRADIMIEGQLIIELKAVNSLVVSHEIQLVNYLTATNIDNGLLINFGGNRIEIKRKYRTYTKQY